MLGLVIVCIGVPIPPVDPLSDVTGDVVDSQGPCRSWLLTLQEA